MLASGAAHCQEPTPPPSPDWGEVIKLDSGTAGVGYVDLVATYEKVSGLGYNYCYKLTSYAKSLPDHPLNLIEGLYLTMQYQPVGFRALLGSETDPWASAWNVACYEQTQEKNWKVSWQLKPGADEAYALAPSQSMTFRFWCMNEPGSEGASLLGIAAAGQTWTGSANVPVEYKPDSSPATVPEPSTVLSALSILGSVGLFGRRVFRK